jgi:hypothetical protein
MQLHQLASELHRERLQEAAHDRLAAQARRARTPRPHHPTATPARWWAAIRLRRLFS